MLNIDFLIDVAEVHHFSEQIFMGNNQEPPQLAVGVFTSTNSARRYEAFSKDRSITRRPLPLVSYRWFVVQR
jgi:hypothetical protein